MLSALMREQDTPGATRGELMTSGTWSPHQRSWDSEVRLSLTGLLTSQVGWQRLACLDGAIEWQ